LTAAADLGMSQSLVLEDFMVTSSSKMDGISEFEKLGIHEGINWETTSTNGDIIGTLGIFHTYFMGYNKLF